MKPDSLVPDFILDVIKARLPQWSAFQEVRWIGERRFNAKCPFCGRRGKFQGDRKANGHWLGKCWHGGCPASGEDGDSLPGLYAKLNGCAFRDAVDALRSELGLFLPVAPHSMKRKTLQEVEDEMRMEAAEKAAKRQTWPEFVASPDIGCANVARLRAIPLDGVRAAHSWGTLRFAHWNGAACWVLRSADGTCAEARRMDGRKFALRDGRQEKALCLPGSEKRNFLVGAHLLGTDPDPCFLTEGGPDWLCACWLAWRAAEYAEAPWWAPLAVLGAGSNIPARYIDRLRGRQVRILAHGDEGGEAAAERWRRQVDGVGGRGEVIRIGALGLVQQNGEAATDLNDVLRCEPEIVEEFTREVLR